VFDGLRVVGLFNRSMLGRDVAGLLSTLHRIAILVLLPRGAIILTAIIFFRRLRMGAGLLSMLFMLRGSGHRSPQPYTDAIRGSALPARFRPRKANYLP
jgi:hypothetical protein